MATDHVTKFAKFSDPTFIRGIGVSKRIAGSQFPFRRLNIRSSRPNPGVYDVRICTVGVDFTVVSLTTFAREGTARQCGDQ